jgi:uracil-DNA glycosylase family 4
MKRGFFSLSQLSSHAWTQSVIPRCGQCGLYRHCHSPKMPPTGEGRKKILVVAEAPGKKEDEEGTQLIGESGQYLRETLDRYDVDLDRDCWKTNSLICHPEGNKLPSNPVPLIEACRPNLLKTIKELDPNVVILLGGTACKSLLPVLWKDEIGQVGQWGSWRIPSQVINAWVCPTFHPAYLIRQPGPTLEMKFRQDIAAAVRLRSKPWKVVPDYKSEVEVIYRPSEAGKAIRELTRKAIRKNIPIAADYETTCLKPEYEGAEIVSCSMSMGSWTISYPWAGETVEATSEMWQTPIGKIASNMKFEDRWTRFFLGHPVRDWYWDTMIAAHLLDNREKVTSVKFQAFVLLGVKAWNEHIEPYLESTKEANHLNRIHELEVKDLLVYGGLDSKLEWLVAAKQIKAMSRMNINATGVY